MADKMVCPTSMFRIKICGITTPEDALLAADAGADAIGLNFYEKSPRCLTLGKAGEIVRALAQQPGESNSTQSPELIGVFVISAERTSHTTGGTLQTMFQLYESSDIRSFSAFQIHGEEPTDLMSKMNVSANIDPKLFAALLPDPATPIMPVIRAFRCQSADLSPVYDYLQACEHYHEQLQKIVGSTNCVEPSLPRAILLDAYRPGMHGGTGQVVDWHMVREQRDKLLGLPLILAGGLTPDNVAEAIATARPDAVDVASGVESSPGKKDSAKVRDFVAAAKEAFVKLGR